MTSTPGEKIKKASRQMRRYGDQETMEPSAPGPVFLDELTSQVTELS